MSEGHLRPTLLWIDEPTKGEQLSIRVDWKSKCHILTYSTIPDGSVEPPRHHVP